MTDFTATDKFDPKESTFIIKDNDPAFDPLTNGPYKQTVYLNDEDITVLAAVLGHCVTTKKIPRHLAEDLTPDVAESCLVNLAFHFAELNHQICQSTIQKMELILQRKLPGGAMTNVIEIGPHVALKRKDALRAIMDREDPFGVEWTRWCYGKQVSEMLAPIFKTYSWLSKHQQHQTLRRT